MASKLAGKHRNADTAYFLDAMIFRIKNMALYLAIPLIKSSYYWKLKMVAKHGTCLNRPML